ncbi:MAG: EAL domain-containing protein [Gammaproteobacteria bacterium]|nr:EAL domain-containing protein [Gammaproteobacteria bacterium]
MRIFNKLSLRNKFLVAPGIGILFLMLLASQFHKASEIQNNYVTNLQKQDMFVADVLLTNFSEFLTNQSNFYSLIIRSSEHKLSGQEIYLKLKPIIYSLHNIEKELKQSAMMDYMKINEIDFYSHLLIDIEQFHSLLLSASEISTVDLNKAQELLQSLTKIFFHAEEDFTFCIQETRNVVEQKSIQMQGEFRAQAIWLVINFIAFLSLMLIISIYLSRKLSGDLALMINSMGELAKGNIHVKVPNLTSSPEVEEMAKSFSIFRKTLQQLDQSNELTLSINQDLNAEIENRQKIESQLRLIATVFEQGTEGIIITDPESIILKVNPAFTSITGYSENEAIGQKANILRSDKHDRAFYQTLWESINNDGQWQGEIWNRRKNGEIYPEWRIISSVLNQEGKLQYYISIFSDITNRKLSEDHIYRLAHYDILTNLPNRSLFQERLTQSIAHAKRNQQITGVLFMDLDGFKNINDSMGHVAGDQLLQAVANRVKACIREEDTLARLGGDEFTLILENLTSLDCASQIADKILNTIKEPIHLSNHEVFITTSIGISLFPDDGEDINTLLKNADVAMYHAKDSGKNTYNYFTKSMQASAKERHKMENYLRHAIKHNEFSLVYQPRVDTITHRIVSLEVLCRWKQPNIGYISPDKFIPLAEETGLIIPLGLWVMETACRQYQQWQNQNIAPEKISINLSGRQFQDKELLSDILSIMENTGVSSSSVELELTESSLMENPEDCINILKHLKKEGIEIAVDDFGTAYSSLSYLKRFPVSVLKIDRSFICDIPTDKDDIAITRSIISLANHMNLTVVAEGVETKEQLNFLKQHNCDQIQGYYFSQPKPVEEIEKILKMKYLHPESSNDT